MEDGLNSCVHPHQHNELFVSSFQNLSWKLLKRGVRKGLKRRGTGPNIGLLINLNASQYTIELLNYSKKKKNFLEIINNCRNEGKNSDLNELMNE